MDIQVWNDFYDSLNFDFKRGALPFRVWQIYNHMVRFVKAGKVAEFICAGGVLSHYIGDACQPLHVSFLHHGRPGHPEEERVHSVYETAMLDRFAADIIAGGKQAAISVIELMRKTVNTLPPLDVIEAYNAASGVQRIPHMFDALGRKTITCIADGALRLAALWASAWKEGGGNKIASSKLVAIDREVLKVIYNDPAFVPALRLKEAAFAAELT